MRVVCGLAIRPRYEMGRVGSLERLQGRVLRQCRFTPEPARPIRQTPCITIQPRGEGVYIMRRIIRSLFGRRKRVRVVWFESAACGRNWPYGRCPSCQERLLGESECRVCGWFEVAA